MDAPGAAVHGASHPVGLAVGRSDGAKVTVMLTEADVEGIHQADAPDAVALQLLDDAPVTNILAIESPPF